MPDVCSPNGDDDTPQLLGRLPMQSRDTKTVNSPRELKTKGVRILRNEKRGYGFKLSRTASSSARSSAARCAPQTPAQPEDSHHGLKAPSRATPVLDLLPHSSSSFAVQSTIPSSLSSPRMIHVDSTSMRAALARLSGCDA